MRALIPDVEVDGSTQIVIFPEWLSSLDAPLARLLQRMLDASPEKRPSADEVLRDDVFSSRAERAQMLLRKAHEAEEAAAREA